MPDVSLTIRSFRHHCDRLLALWTAVAVSYLFAVMPFGNPNVGYMPAAPSAASMTAAASLAPAAPEEPAVSSPLSWDGDCHVVWATLNDDDPQPPHWTAPGTFRHGSAPGASGTRPALNHRPLPGLTRVPYHLRAPPRNA